jgi:DnaJ-class molecular chaperone
VLSDAEKRRIYDRYGEEGLKQHEGRGGGGGGPQDIFSQCALRVSPLEPMRTADSTPSCVASAVRVIADKRLNVKSLQILWAGRLWLWGRRRGGGGADSQGERRRRGAGGDAA